MAFYSLLIYFATSMGTHTMAAHQVSFTSFCFMTDPSITCFLHIWKTKLKTSGNSYFRSWSKPFACAQYGVNLSRKLLNHLCPNCYMELIKICQRLVFLICNVTTLMSQDLLHILISLASDLSCA